MRLVLSILVLALTALPVAPSFAQIASAPPISDRGREDEAKVRAVIAEWYRRVSQPEAQAARGLLAPGAVDGGPGYHEIPYQPPEQRSAAAYSGRMINNELASKAMKFAYDIDVLKVDPRLAKAIVWERGYFFAAAAQVTYENAASAMFVLEKQGNGEWKILAHEATSQGIPPNKITSPMPDLRDLYYSRCPTCDPVADAKKAKEF